MTVVPRRDRLCQVASNLFTLCLRIYPGKVELCVKELEAAQFSRIKPII